MPHALKAKPPELRRIDVAEAANDLHMDEPVLATDPDGVHARYYQQLLTEAYRGTAPEEKLPGQQRLAIIFGIASGLWLLIGLVAFTA